MSDKVRAVVLGVLLVAIGAGLAVWYRANRGAGGAAPTSPEKATNAAASPAAVSSTASAVEPGIVRMVEAGSSGIADQMMAAVMLALREGFRDRLKVEFVDVGRDPSLKEKLGVKVVPTQIFYSPSGRELGRHEGYASEQTILKKWKELGYDLMSQAAPSGRPEEGE